jgi:hypothetical protein
VTARRRAGQVGDAMRRGMTVPTRSATHESVVAVGEVPELKNKPVTSKYTALLDAETAAVFDELALIARRKLGRKVDKSELVRALIMLAADDGSLREQVIGEIERRER